MEVKMDGLDLVNFFYDETAAKIWYRDIEWKTEDSLCIIYKSKLDLGNSLSYR